MTVQVRSAGAAVAVFFAVLYASVASGDRQVRAARAEEVAQVTGGAPACVKDDTAQCTTVNIKCVENECTVTPGSPPITTCPTGSIQKETLSPGSYAQVTQADKGANGSTPQAQIFCLKTWQCARAGQQSCSAVTNDGTTKYYCPDGLAAGPGQPADPKTPTKADTTTCPAANPNPKIDDPALDPATPPQ